VGEEKPYAVGESLPSKIEEVRRRIQGAFVAKRRLIVRSGSGKEKKLHQGIGKKKELLASRTRPRKKIRSQDPFSRGGDEVERKRGGKAGVAKREQVCTVASEPEQEGSHPPWPRRRKRREKEGERSFVPGRWVNLSPGKRRG